MGNFFILVNLETQPLELFELKVHFSEPTSNVSNVVQYILDWKSLKSQYFPPRGKNGWILCKLILVFLVRIRLSSEARRKDCKSKGLPLSLPFTNFNFVTCMESQSCEFFLSSSPLILIHMLSKFGQFWQQGHF